MFQIEIKNADDMDENNRSISSFLLDNVIKRSSFQTVIVFIMDSLSYENKLNIRRW